MNMGLGLLFIVISIPMLRGMVGRNGIYGFRIAKSFQSEENWQRINKHGARGMIYWSAIIMAASPMALFVELERDPVLTMLFSMMFLLIFIPIVNTLRYARGL